MYTNPITFARTALPEKKYTCSAWNNYTGAEKSRQVPPEESTQLPPEKSTQVTCVRALPRV